MPDNRPMRIVLFFGFARNWPPCWPLLGGVKIRSCNSLVISVLQNRPNKAAKEPKSHGQRASFAASFGLF